MQLIRLKAPVWYLLLSLSLVALVSCSGDQPVPSTPEPSPTPSATQAPPAANPTPIEPSPTSAPLAARVDGEDLLLSQYQAELERYQAAVGTELATEDQQRVLNDLIDQLLLAQAAAEAGFELEEAALEDRIRQLQESLGSAQALEQWMAEHNYTAETFRHDLARSIAAAWMRDQIIAAVPETAEQVHARQILLYNPEQAEEYLSRLRSGADFAALAAEVDPVTKGELGWFPRGYLLDPTLDEAAFRLEAQEYSDVIQTEAGYHILQVIERDPQRLLEPDARLRLQEQALQAWLDDRRTDSVIEILIQ